MPLRALTNPAVALAGAAALLGAGVFMGVYSERTYGRQKIDEAQSQAQILAAIVPAALAFDDRAAALDYLNALKANNETVAAALYDEDGQLFAGFARDGAAAPPEVLVDAPPYFDGGQVVVTAPVTEAGARLGAVMLRSVTEPFSSRLTRYSGIMLLFFMAALLFAILSAANRALAQANAGLKRQAEQLAAANVELSNQIGEREKAEAQLRQAQKMETIGHLTGGIAHDFNNLLTIVIGNIERARRRLGKDAGDAEIETALDFARRGAERAASLTKSLLAFARRQPLNPQTVDINKLVADISDLLRRTLGETIEIEVVRGAGLWKVSIDPNQLESALVNLAVNARDAMPEGGKLTIETANAYLDREYADIHEEVEPGQYVALCVTDTGTGIDPGLLDRVFEPFFTTKETGHGTGLGLSQVYGFVKQSGGHIKVYSEPGDGATVKIYLPRDIADERPVSRERRGESIRRGKAGVRVLVVEDEPDVRAHAIALIEELGYGAEAAADGREALERLQAEDGVSILFTDVGLPGGMNGRQLAEEAKRLRPGLKVVFTTGYARNAIVHEGRLDPGVNLVTKPFSYDDMGHALARALDERPDVSASPVMANRKAKPVLLVEDDALIRATAASDIESLGFEVLEAGSAAAALKLAAENETRLAAAVIDLGLPDKRGDILAGELRALDPGLRIVIASGFAGEEIKERFSSDPATAFVDKPYTAAQLEKALKPRTLAD